MTDTLQTGPCLHERKSDDLLKKIDSSVWFGPAGRRGSTIGDFFNQCLLKAVVNQQDG